ncbi:ferritin-like domain-containing protein [Planctobacterium marinum]|uniref:Iminophenyl-pyruvate dimer synthase domain-containing protein n=1 Tax=Planctobacterium marinum TaxID=1631968 RepID=A0AA48KSB1_9ALTE|nr:hypothetical protein MACH26_18250 [Planctobacterium marinum]
MKVQYNVPALTPNEVATIEKINNDEQTYGGGKALKILQQTLQTAAEVELATIPIYLGAYYTINRTPGKDNPGLPHAFPKTDLSRYANEAGALIMSVAVEEMLHMSLACNVLFAVSNEPPLLYKNAPESYPAVLPGHRANQADNPKDNTRNQPIPLAGFSFDQLSHFLAIEYPESADAMPESDDWDTIGQIYSYVRCLIESNWISDDDFNKANNNDQQISSGDYSPNNIDTVYAKSSFNYQNPIPAEQPGSAAAVAGYGSDEDSHVGQTQLMQITNKKTAVQAITTICFQGEGFAQSKYDDASDEELSHYYKFLTLLSQLEGYTDVYKEMGKLGFNNVAPLPEAPDQPAEQFSAKDLAKFVYPTPVNPKVKQFGGEGRQDLVNIADALFQYMLVMTETIYKIPAQKQKIYFYRTMHQSMIWVMDKLFQAMREVSSEDGKYSLCPTFSNIDLGTRDEAYGNMCQMVINFQQVYWNASDTKASWMNSDIESYLNDILNLPDVSQYWRTTGCSEDPIYLTTPTDLQGLGSNTDTPTPATPMVYAGPFAGTPLWPQNPPSSAELPEGAVRHACMGLNSCKNQGRTLSNDCAGQGYCSTAQAYNPANPFEGNNYDHTCHVKNDCRNQGGCGLYGTEAELAEPGHNDCQSQGSCATPINAERFLTDGDNRGKSVWMQAREVFKDKVWPDLRAQNPDLPAEPPQVKGPYSNPNLFAQGPTIGWIEYDNDGAGMTACGASGMSGAGSCA